MFLILIFYPGHCRNNYCKAPHQFGHNAWNYKQHYHNSTPENRTWNTDHGKSDSGKTTLQQLFMVTLLIMRFLQIKYIHFVIPNHFKGYNAIRIIEISVQPAVRA